MKPVYLRVGGGLLLVLAGILLLLQNLKVIPSNQGWVWGLVFLLGGLMFLAVYVTDRRHWWALFPGVPLLGLGIMTGATSLFPFLGGTLWGAFFMAMISLAFWLVFIARPQLNWWAILPGGVLLTLAAMIGLSAIYRGFEEGGFLFLGIGLTFLLLYFLPAQYGGQRWAVYPAIPLLILGVIVVSAAISLWNYAWPLFLVLLGVWFLWRAFRPGRNTPVTRL